jgi:hypothetical protein
MFVCCVIFDCLAPGTFVVGDQGWIWPATATAAVGLLSIFWLNRQRLSTQWLGPLLRKFTAQVRR